MHQSRKEQGMVRASRRLLSVDIREAQVLSLQDGDAEFAEEWGNKPQHARNSRK